MSGDNWRPEHQQRKRPDDWAKPRSHGTPLTVAEIAKIKAAYIASRTIPDIARELQCASRTVGKYYMLIRLTHASANARTMGLSGQSRPAPVED